MICFVQVRGALRRALPLPSTIIGDKHREARASQYGRYSGNWSKCEPDALCGCRGSGLNLRYGYAWLCGTLGERNARMRGLIALGTVTCALGMAAGCGGGAAAGAGMGSRHSGAAGDGSLATAAPVGALTTASGAVVSDRTRDIWLAGVEAFEKAEKTRWSSDQCKSVPEHFRRAAKSQGQAIAEVDFMLGLVLERCGEESAALASYRQALATDPKYCKARVALGLNDLRTGRTKQAEQLFVQAKTNDPQCTEAYVNLGLIQASSQPPNMQEALNNYRRALAIESDYLPAFNQMALLYLDWAKREKSPEKIRLAEIVCKQATLVDEKYAPIYNTWGLIEVEKGNVIPALRMFKKATDLDDSLFEAYLNFGQMTMSFRGYDDSKNAFARALELDPNSYDAMIGLGIASRGLKQFSEAKAIYERALKLSSQRPEAYYNLGVLYQDYMSGSVGDMRTAKTFFERFLDRARGDQKLAGTVEDVTRRCAPPKGRRKRSTDCRPGRLQNIETVVAAMSSAGG